MDHSQVRRLFSVFAMASLVLSGCAEDPSLKDVQAALRPLDDCLTEMTATLDTIRDDASAQEAAKKLESLTDRYKSTYMQYLTATRQVSAARGSAATPLDTSHANALFDQKLTQVMESVPSAGKHLGPFMKKHSEIRGVTSDEKSVDEPAVSKRQQEGEPLGEQ